MTRSKRGRCPETARAGSAARACRIARAAHLHGRAKQARGALVGEHADSVIVTTINAETAETAEILENMRNSASSACCAFDVFAVLIQAYTPPVDFFSCQIVPNLSPAACVLPER